MYWRDSHRTLYNADCRSMVDLSDESIQCVVTSPPYWGLRKYSGLPDLIWGGDEKCQHNWQLGRSSFKKSNQGVGSNVLPITEKLAELNAQIDPGSSFCSLCGAWKGAYGLEPTPDCGRPFAKLRSDLTEKEIDYVMGELKRCGLI